MSSSQQDALQALQKSQAAFKRGDKQSARGYARQALKLAPELEEPWLMLAALSAPKASLAYLEQALRINPSSKRASQGLVWVAKRLEEEPAPASPRQALITPTRKKQIPQPSARRQKHLPALFLLLLISVLGWAGWSGRFTPVKALILGTGNATATLSESWSQVEIPKPSYTPTHTPTFTPTSTPTFTPTPTNTPTSTPTFTPTLTPTNTRTPWPTWTPAPYKSPTPKPVFSGGNGARWIDVDLTRQMVYAYEGTVLVNSFLVSTGTWQTPTVTGQFRIYIKNRSQDMSGPGYYLSDVPYVMFFYKGYGFHGTYWHNNFGTPMSHGCVNMRTSEAGWLYSWASIGTLVNVHY